jgi:hypothetical protein
MNLQLLTPIEKNLGTFSVKRLLPSPKRQMVGPWIFFDHFGSATLNAGEGLDVRPHPHINLGTVTYLFSGEIVHRDSLGSHQSILPGDIKLMIAGNGIVHSEREPDNVRSEKRVLHGLQFWFALQEEDEETDPAFYHYPAEQIPQDTIDGVQVRILIGQGVGMNSPVKTFSPIFFAALSVTEDQQLELPALKEYAIYIIKGELQSSHDILDEKCMFAAQDSEDVFLKARKNTQFVIIGGDSMGKRHISWNFVSSRSERIAQAKEDWKNRRFPVVPGDEHEYIPPPDG